MARLNIEDRFFGEARLLHLAQILKCSTHQAIGILTYLWHDSQTHRQHIATSDDIVIWCRVNEIRDKEEWEASGVFTTDALLIGALVKSKYIRKLSDDNYEIIGNKHQIEMMEKAFQKSKKAAEKRWLNNRYAPSTDKNLQQGGIIPSPIQSKPIQSKDIYIAQFDIEGLYELYPRKIGKKKGLAICKRVIKNEKDYDLVRLAIGNYTEWLKHEKKEDQFIKHFSTFMNSWEDWIDVTPKQEVKPIFNFDEDSNV